MPPRGTATEAGGASADASAPETAPLASSNLGRYRLIAGLGRGGMGDVFLAVAQGLAGFNKLVVIKQLRPSLAADAEFLAMFLDEARLAARLNHPNIVQTNEVGQDAANRYFIAMEHLDGQPYHRVLRRARASGGLSVSLQLQVLMGVLDGLHHAHGVKGYDGAPLDIVHRDVSPQNVFVTYAGDCKVLDFGVAKAIGSTAETRSGTTKGKVAYMAPEQLHGEEVDRRADVFSVGVMLWDALAGRPLWQGLPNLDIARRLLAGQIPRARDLQPAIDPALAAICDRALAPGVRERYQSALEMRADLDVYLDKAGARTTRQDLAAVMERLFAADRLQMQRVIEAQLVDARALGDREYAVLPLPIVEESSPVASASPAPAPGGRSGLLDPDPDPLPPPARGGGARRRAGLAAGLLLLLAALGIAAIRLRPRAPPAPGPTAVVRMPALELTARPKEPEVPLLEVRVTPATATLRFDGEVASLPFQRPVVPDGHTHELRVEAEGYRPQSRSVVVDGPLVLEIALEREPGPAPHPALPEVERVRHAPAPARRSPPARAAPRPEPEPPLAQAPPEPAPVAAPPPPPAKPRIDIIADPKVDIVE